MADTPVKPDDCTCTDHAIECLRKMRAGEVKQVGRQGLDLQGNRLCTVDSFGFRSNFEGECDPCYARQVAGYNAAMKATFDDDY